MTDLARFQDDLRKQGYVQVPRTDMKVKTYAITGTDVFVVNGEYIDRYIFTTNGKTAGVRMQDQLLTDTKTRKKKVVEEDFVFNELEQ